LWLSDEARRKIKVFLLFLSLVSNLITFLHLLDLSDSQYNFLFLPKEINLWSTLQQFFHFFFCGNFYDVGNQLQNRTGTTLKIIYFSLHFTWYWGWVQFCLHFTIRLLFPFLLTLFYWWLSYLEKFCDLFKLLFLMTFFSAFFGCHCDHFCWLDANLLELWLLSRFCDLIWLFVYLDSFNWDNYQVD
jgi:hypothetical protein